MFFRITNAHINILLNYKFRRTGVFSPYQLRELNPDEREKVVILYDVALDYLF
jgi:hypothetical protein